MVTSAERFRNARSPREGVRRMNHSLKRTLKSLLFAGAALMILVAGSANWPKH